MFDINTISNTTCLICRDKLFDITERDPDKKFTKKEYKIYLKPITKLDCNHYYHIECLKASYLVESKGSFYNFSKKCPYCSSKTSRINSLYNELDCKNELIYDKPKREIKRIKNNNDCLEKKHKCVCITASGKRCKLFEKYPGSKYCRIHTSKKNLEEKCSSEEIIENNIDTSMFSKFIGDNSNKTNILVM